MNRTRGGFTHTELLCTIRTTFEEYACKLPPAILSKKWISLTDCLMGGLAIFSLKYASLLQFENDKESEPRVRKNLHTLYGIKKVPCDTYLRERLDGLDISFFQRTFAQLFSLMQRGKILENWKYLNNRYVISLDATGFFSSHKVHCSQCCEKILHKGTEKETITYHHQMLVGSIVSPEIKQVLPIGFEPIIKEDGAQKNDCERNGAKRWLTTFRQSHPQLPTLIVADGLYSNAPFIHALEEARCSYILVAREEDHSFLYEYFWAGEGEDIGEFTRETQEIKQDKKKEQKREKAKKQRFRFMNNVPLNEANQDLKVNVLYFEEEEKEDEEVNKKKKPTKKAEHKIRKWLWVTDVEITQENALSIMKGGRARWKIENETFNTLKNQGYSFEHNFGHGYNGLSNVFAGLMLLAFLVDQMLASVNLEYQAVLKKCFGSFSYLFTRVRSKFFEHLFPSFEKMYEAMLGGAPPVIAS